jgi:hypothetical protein
MKGKILILILFYLVSTTCNKKNWDNPYDEEGNPNYFEKPEEFAVSQINDSTVELTWSAANQNIDGFIIERKKTNLSYTKVSDLINKELDKWLDTDIEPNTEYFYRIYAVAGENTSDFSSTSITTKVNLPEVTIISIDNITASSLTCKCKIVNNGGSAITDKGVCWNTSGNPTIYSNTKSLESGSDSFSIEISDLAPGTKYYFRAFAYNSKGRGYGAEKNATTKTTIPSVETLEISEITRTSLKSGGNITSTGGEEITSKGICWNKSGNPTINDNKTNDGSGNDDFISVADNLEMETTYYVRAFAMNKNGLSYGNELSSSTLSATQPILSDLYLQAILPSSAICKSRIVDDGGMEIIEKGFCWNTSGNPTVLDNKKIITTDYSNFESTITNFSDHTKYFVRAYAKNTKGTQYSNELSFYAIEELPSIDYNGSLYVYPIDICENCDWYEAKNICNNLSAYGYDDWYLPDTWELSKIIDELENGNFLIDCYWSSEQGSSYDVACRICNNTGTNSMNCNISKTTKYRVRCVRRD